MIKLNKIRPDIDMLLLVGKGIRGGICHVVYRYAKATNKYVKDYDKNKGLPMIYTFLPERMKI